MKKSGLLFTVILTCSVYVADGQHLKVNFIEFGTQVNKRQIVKSDTSFANNIHKIYCYTRVTGAQDTTAKIFHVWYYKDQEKARIPLPIKSGDWRTWSSKSILPQWSGRWRVMIEDQNGEVLATKSFTVRSSKN